MGRMGLMDTDEIPNIRLQVYEFVPENTTFYV